MVPQVQNTASQAKQRIEVSKLTKKNINKKRLRKKPNKKVANVEDKAQVTGSNATPKKKTGQRQDLPNDSKITC